MSSRKGMKYEKAPASLVPGTREYQRFMQRRSRQLERDRIGVDAQRIKWADRMRKMRSRDRDVPGAADLAARMQSSLAAARAKGVRV